MTKLKWRKRRSGLLVPEPLWFIRVYLPRQRDPLRHEVLSPHYWSEETKTFTEDLEHVTSFKTRKQAEAALFWITAKHAPSIMGQGMNIEAVRKMPTDVMLEERVADQPGTEELT